MLLFGLESLQLLGCSYGEGVYGISLWSLIKYKFIKSHVYMLLLCRSRGFHLGCLDNSTLSNYQ